MFSLAAPFGMRFIAADPFGSAADGRQLGVEMTDLETVFRKSDFLAVNCPLTEQTRGLVNAERLAMMKPAAFLINTARGPIVDQPALARALSNGVIAGAGLDVLEREPPDPSDVILHLDNVIVTPHALCWTDELFRGLAGDAVAAALEVMHGRVPRVLVDGAVADNPAFRARLAANAAAFRAA
jgi:phosphoglycerate dehydrogenase-like enzyme